MFMNFWVWVGLVGVAIGVAVVVGRDRSVLRRRIRDLEAHAEALDAAREQAVAEAAAREKEVAELQRQLEAYRGRVVEHFNGSWDLMRALVLRYRADFEQLAEGESPPWEMALVEPTRTATLPAKSASKEASGGTRAEGGAPSAAGPGGRPDLGQHAR